KRAGAARGARRRGAPRPYLDHADRADRGRRGRADDGALRAGARARRLRPGDPAADRARGLLAAALHRDGDARPGRPAPRRPRGRRGGARDRSAEGLDDRRLMAGIFVTGTDTEIGKTVVAAVLARTQADDGKRVAVFKPALSGMDEFPGYEEAAARAADSVLGL